MKPADLPDPHDAAALQAPAVAAAAVAAPVTPQPHGAYGFVAPLVASRVEILVTLLVDGALLVGSAFVRAGALFLIHLLGDAAKLGWPILILELILDVGIVLTAMIITTFDIVKRIRLSYQDATT
jgi:hypothetical protein